MRRKGSTPNVTTTQLINFLIDEGVEDRKEALVPVTLFSKKWLLFIFIKKTAIIFVQ